MAQIIKINTIALGELNNTEYTYFSQQVAGFAFDTEALHLNAATLAAYEANVQKMTDIVAQSRRADETAEIADIDKQADDLIVYLLGAIRSAKSSPLAAQRTAGTTLYNATHPYLGMQRLPQRQEVQQARGLLVDLEKPELKLHVKTLGLNEVVISLAETIDTYAGLLDSRANTQVANTLEAGKTVRTEMDAQYDEITTTVFAFSIAQPTEATATFITSLNKLIGDTKAAYNQRLAQAHAAAEKKQSK